MFGRADELEDHVEGTALGEALAGRPPRAQRGDLLAQLGSCARSRSRRRPPRAPAGSRRCRRRPRRRAPAGARPGSSPAWMKTRVVGGREDLGQPAGRRPVERPRGPAISSALVHHRQLGLRAAADDRHHARARLRSASPRPERDAPRPPAPCRGCPAGSRAAPGRARAAASCRRRSARRRAPARSTSSRAGDRDRGAPRSRSPARGSSRRAPRKPRRSAERERLSRVGTGSLEQRDALDVVGLREHVDRAHPLQRAARLDQFGRVRGERRRVAGDVDDPLRRRVDDAVHDLLREARRGAGRRRPRPGARRARAARAAPGACRRRRSWCS